ncbi:MAG: lipocalin family protein [Nonlabens sp.]|uniref:lipocalin family protein n=1 Tax=Nonlabens sp. TaxID=1888209 RepID=UPI003EF1720F
MKYFIFFVFTSLLISCNTSDDPGNILDYDLEGTWKLTEVLADPGDGSGTFQTVTSSKTITFDANGGFTSNGTVCDLSITSTSNTSGTYNAVDQTINGNCGTTNLPITYDIIGSALEITYPCFEPCMTRYRKIN